MSTISLSMIVKNEAQNVGRCLASVAGVVDEIAVVDTGSTDETPELLAGLGARVEHHPWRNSFSHARNLALAMARCDWVLVLDADEELPPETRSRLRSVVDAAMGDGLLMRVRNLNTPAELAAFYESWQLRIVRNGHGYAFENDIHEQIIHSIVRAGGRIEQTDLALVHYGYLADTVQGDANRTSRNLQLLLAAVGSNPRSAYLWAHLGLAQFASDDETAALGSLKRALFDLNGRDLSLEVLHKAFLTLGRIGLSLGQHDLALACATASLQAGRSDAYASLLGLKVAAYAHLGKAKRLLTARRAALNAAKSGGVVITSRAADVDMQEIAHSLRSAGVYFASMLHEPGLSDAARAQAVQALEIVARLESVQSATACQEPVPSHQL